MHVYRKNKTYFHVPLFKDLNDGNTICVDTNKTWCLEPEHHLELVFSVVERISEVSINEQKIYQFHCIKKFYIC